MKEVKEYYFNYDLRAECEDSKKELGDMRFLEPCDPQKKLFLQTDASKKGLGEVLYQYDDEFVEETKENHETENKRVAMKDLETLIGDNEESKSKRTREKEKVRL